MIIKTIIGYKLMNNGIYKPLYNHESYEESKHVKCIDCDKSIKVHMREKRKMICFNCYIKLTKRV